MAKDGHRRTTAELIGLGDVARVFDAAAIETLASKKFADLPRGANLNRFGDNVRLDVRTYLTAKARPPPPAPRPRGRPLATPEREFVWALSVTYGDIYAAAETPTNIPYTASDNPDIAGPFPRFVREVFRRTGVPPGSVGRMINDLGIVRRWIAVEQRRKDHESN